MTEKGAAFLNQHFLQMAREDESVQRATRRETEGYKEGQKITPEKKIQAFLQRLEKLVDPQNSIQKERNIAMLSHLFVEKVMIAPEDVPEAYFANQLEIGRQMGLGTQELTYEAREQEIDRIQADQQESLETWVNYLAQNDGQYPMWFRYYVLRSVVKYEPLDRQRGTFKKRSETTTKPFPELNAEAVALVFEDLKAKVEDGKLPDDPARAGLVSKGGFADLYADSIRRLAETAHRHQEGKEQTTEGEWVKYDKGSDGAALSDAIQGYDTGWCIAGLTTAQTYVDRGDFYVYFSYDKQQKATVPRAAISVTDLGVTEVRGVQPGQNLEPEMTEIVNTKLQELPEGDKYHKKVEDMRTLTTIEEKMKNRESPSQAELRFLYEVDTRIEGFGYGDDPRIVEIKGKRNQRQDLATIYDCEVSQVVLNEGELNDETIVLVGDFSAKNRVDMPTRLQVITGQANFEGSQVTDLGQLTSIWGSVNFRISQITDLGSLATIGGDAIFTGSSVRNLGQLTTIGVDARFNRSNITDLGQLTTIRGIVDFRNSQITNLGQLTSIGGKAFITQKEERLITFLEEKGLPYSVVE